MARSAGMMVNYVYRLADVERNHERYFADHAVVGLARGGQARARVPDRGAPPARRRGLSACSRARCVRLEAGHARRRT